MSRKAADTTVARALQSLAANANGGRMPPFAYCLDVTRKHWPERGKRQTCDDFARVLFAKYPHEFKGVGSEREKADVSRANEVGDR